MHRFSPRVPTVTSTHILSKASLAADRRGRREAWSVFRLEAKEKRIDMLRLEADLQTAIRAKISFISSRS